MFAVLGRQQTWYDPQDRHRYAKVITGMAMGGWWQVDGVPYSITR
jgi:hypothetical protein